MTSFLNFRLSDFRLPRLPDFRLPSFKTSVKFNLYLYFKILKFYSLINSYTHYEYLFLLILLNLNISTIIFSIFLIQIRKIKLLNNFVTILCLSLLNNSFFYLFSTISVFMLIDFLETKNKNKMEEDEFISGYISD